jgi:hypothetical protein
MPKHMELRLSERLENRNLVTNADLNDVINSGSNSISFRSKLLFLSVVTQQQSSVL